MSASPRTDLAPTPAVHARVAVIATPADPALLDRVLAMGRAANLWDAEMMAELYALRTRLAGG